MNSNNIYNPYNQDAVSWTAPHNYQNPHAMSRSMNVNSTNNPFHAPHPSSHPSVATPAVRSILRATDAPDSPDSPGAVPSARSMPDDNYGYHQHRMQERNSQSYQAEEENWIERTASGGLLMMNQHRNSISGNSISGNSMGGNSYGGNSSVFSNSSMKKSQRGASHWFKKKVLGMEDAKLPQMTELESRCKADTLAALLEMEDNEQLHQGTKQVIKFGMAPYKPREVRSNAHFGTTLSPAQAQELYRAKLKSASDSTPKQVVSSTLTMRAAANRNTKLQPETSDLSNKLKTHSEQNGTSVDKIRYKCSSQADKTRLAKEQNNVYHPEPTVHIVRYSQPSSISTKPPTLSYLGAAPSYDTNDLNALPEVKCEELLNFDFDTATKNQPSSAAISPISVAGTTSRSHH